MTTHGRRRKRSLVPPTLALVLMFLLAGLMGAILNDQLDRVFSPEPKPAPTVTDDVLIGNRFAEKVREDIPSLDVSLGNQQITGEARAVCAALAERPLPDVYYSHELPVGEPEDAVRFFAMAVAWQCPEHMAELSELETP